MILCKCVKSATTTDSVFSTWNVQLNPILWIWMIGAVLMKANIHFIMELVSQQLDEYRNNGAISKLTEILLN